MISRKSAAFLMLAFIAGSHTFAAEPATNATATSTYPSPPAVLPGKGLAQHDFRYSGEWDTRKDKATMFLIKAGKVVWTCQIPRKDESNGQESAFSDMHLLSNGEIVFAYKTGWRKITGDGKTIYEYKCPKGAEGWNECHSAQPIGMDKVLFMETGRRARSSSSTISRPAKWRWSTRCEPKSQWIRNPCTASSATCA